MLLMSSSDNFSYKQQARRVARQRQRRPLVRKLQLAGLVIFVLFHFWLGWLLSASGMLAEGKLAAREAMIKTSLQLGMTLERVYVDGLVHLKTEDVLKHLPSPMPEENAIPLYGVDPYALKAKLETLGWVKHATIERQLPDALHVIIEERQPAAIWQFQGKLKVVDESGIVIEDKKLGAFADLPIIVGEDAHRHVQQVMTIFSVAEVLYPRVAAAVRVGDRRWNIKLVNGTMVKLPEVKPEEAWKNFAQLTEKEGALVEYSNAEIDLRMKDRIYFNVPGLSAGELTTR